MERRKEKKKTEKKPGVAYRQPVLHHITIRRNQNIQEVNKETDPNSIRLPNIVVHLSLFILELLV